MTMPISKYKELFQENVIMTIDHLKIATGRPRESILRDLKGIGYYSSYNERGKFYTLADTPEFDGLGLWKYLNAYFSIRRTLLDTAEYLISSSNAGFTHDELKQMLGIAIHNSLHHLIVADRIARRLVGAQYVYFGKEKIDEQLEERSAMPIVPITRKKIRLPDAHGIPDMEPILVIDILVGVLRGNETESAVHSYLQLTDSPVTEQQIAMVFRFYGLGKKNSSKQK
jgi:hypothetical protein